MKLFLAILIIYSVFLIGVCILIYIAATALNPKDEKTSYEDDQQ
jgi:phage shock protein PspC (stress-responsive transcriptional regulator)